MSVTTTDTNGNAALMSFIERASRDDTFDVGKFGELLRLQRDVQHDQAKRAFNQAMALAQAEMLPVVRSARNVHTGNKYAKLEAIDAQMRPIYTANGFSVRYGSAAPPQPGWSRITCTVAHEAGYYEENYLNSPVSTTGSQGGKMAMTPVQAIGATVTYLRRYLLSMVFNIVLADDDADGEEQRRAAPPPYTRQAAAQTPPDPLDEGDGRRWLVNLETALASAQSQDEVVVIGGHRSVNAVTCDPAAPPDVKRRVSELLASAYARFADPDTGEIKIHGEEKMAAG